LRYSPVSFLSFLSGQSKDFARFNTHYQPNKTVKVQGWVNVTKDIIVGCRRMEDLQCCIMFVCCLAWEFTCVLSVLSEILNSLAKR